MVKINHLLSQSQRQTKISELESQIFNWSSELLKGARESLRANYSNMKVMSYKKVILKYSSEFGTHLCKYTNWAIGRSRAYSNNAFF